MTARGFRKHNSTGRSSDTLKGHRVNRLNGPFVPLTQELLASPVWGVLTLADRKVLDRLCLEHMAHGGQENGNLKCTYNDFVEYGVRRATIADAIRRLEVFGLIEIVQRGGITRAEFKHPTIYRLTFVQGNLAATDDWKRIPDIKTAKRLAQRVSSARGRDGIRKRKNKMPDAETEPVSDAEMARLRSIPGRGSGTPPPDAETELRSIFRPDGTSSGERTASGPANPKGQGRDAGDGDNSWRRMGDILAATGRLKAAE
jgi:hypothetical protein